MHAGIMQFGVLLSKVTWLMQTGVFIDSPTQLKVSLLEQSGIYPFEQNVPVEQRAPVEPEDVVEVDVEVDEVVEVLLEVVFVEQTKAISGLQSKDIPLLLQHSRDWKFGSPKQVAV